MKVIYRNDAAKSQVLSVYLYTVDFWVKKV